MPVILCPLCQQILEQHPRTWCCPQGHSYDVAREGYVNLLLVQQKKSKTPGDNADMVKARRAFLDAGYYQPLREAVVAALTGLAPANLLDIGCGEGYYTAAMARVCPDLVALDIAKPALQLAAKRYPGPVWLVASAARLPLETAAVAGVTSLFSPLPSEEMARVLVPGGFVLMATPAADHLWSLRAALFGDVVAHEPDKFQQNLEPLFERISCQEVRVPLDLDQSALKNLVLMTPYAWRARPEGRQALESHSRFLSEAAFTLQLYRKR